MSRIPEVQSSLEVPFLLPTNEVRGKIMFLHLSMILFTGGGVYPPVGQTPQADTIAPPSDTTGYGQQAGGMHPTGMYSC